MRVFALSCLQCDIATVYPHITPLLEKMQHHNAPRLCVFSCTLKEITQEGADSSLPASSLPLGDCRIASRRCVELYKLVEDVGEWHDLASLNPESDANAMASKNEKNCKKAEAGRRNL
jgi:hypothetical protein